MLKKSRLTAILAGGALALGLSTAVQAQTGTDVTVLDGTGNVIAANVHSFDENEAGSGLAIGFVPVVGDTFTFLYQANIVSFNDALGQSITPMAGLNGSFASGGYEFTIVARIEETVASVTTIAGVTTVVFTSNSGTASIFYDNASSGGVQSVTATGAGFDDGHLVALFDVFGGGGVSTFTTFPSGTGLGATFSQISISGGSSVDAAYIAGLTGPVAGLAFTSSQTIPPGTSLTTGFHLGTPSNATDIYSTTPVGNDLLLKVDGSNTFTTAVPEPETYALMLAGLGALGFMTRRRRRQAR